MKKKFHGNTKHYVGERFGNIIIADNYPGIRNRKWLMKCDCGFDFEAFSANVTSGKTTRCLKCQAAFLSKKKTIDIIGKRFGRLVVIERKEKKWLCQCDCGNTCLRSTSGLNYVKKRKCKSHCGKCNRATGEINRVPDDNFTAQRKRREPIHKMRLGKKFRWFKILSYEYVNVGIRNRCYYTAKCKCGNHFKLRAEQLPYYWSCGCYQKQQVSEIAKKKRILTDDDLKNCVHLFRECGYTRTELADIYGVQYVYMCVRLSKFLDKHENPDWGKTRKKT